jgi:serine protease Do
MKQLIKRFFFTLMATALLAPVCLLAQDEKNKEKELKAKKEGEQIIITRKGNKDEKTVIEVQGDKVIVNGKEVKEGDSDNDVTVRRHKIKDVWAFGGDGLTGTFNGPGDHFRMFDVDENKAMLGFTTEQADNGVEIQSVSKESGAEKAGLKKGDVITKINDKKISTPDELSETIRDHEPGDKVTVTILRDKKEQKITAELGKYKGVRAFSTTIPGQGFNFDLGELGRAYTVPRARIAPTPNFNFNWSGGGPKLGVSVQDTEDGKGVNVIDVDEDGNAAKAGIKENDIITEVDGKAVNGADEIAKLIRESRDKTSVKVKLLRKGKAETVEVKIPRKLKSADL